MSGARDPVGQLCEMAEGLEGLETQEVHVSQVSGTPKAVLSRYGYLAAVIIT